MLFSFKPTSTLSHSLCVGAALDRLVTPMELDALKNRDDYEELRESIDGLARPRRTPTWA